MGQFGRLLRLTLVACRANQLTANCAHNMIAMRHALQVRATRWPNSALQGHHASHH